jgi:hypothetical protein
MHRYRAELTSSIGETTTVDGYCGAYEWGPTDYDCPTDFDVIARRDAVSWRVTGLTIFYLGHERSIYTERDLEQQLGGPPPALQVNATTDDNPPDAYLLSVEPETVDVSATDRWVHFTYFASDGETRVDRGDVRVSHRGGEVPSPESSTLIVDDWPEVQFSEYVMIPRGSPSGDYEITVRVEDRFGNARVYGPGQPFQLDPSTFEVTNGP